MTENLDQADIHSRSLPSDAVRMVENFDQTDEHAHSLPMDATRLVESLDRADILSHNLPPDAARMVEETDCSIRFSSIYPAGRIEELAARLVENPNRPGCFAPLYPGERIDDLERSGLMIIQNPEKFCFGMDAVLLSGFARVKKGETCIDLGCGNGIIPLLLSARSEGKRFIGLEIQEPSADLARRSIALNGLENRIEIINGDLRGASGLLGTSSFPVVTCNPPYMTAQHGLTNPDPARAIARHEVLCTLEDVIRESAALLMPGGRFYLVHRPFRLAEIISLMVRYHLEPKRMRLVYPYADREPNMVLLEGIRGARPRITVEKPLIVWDAPGKYTQEMREDYGY